MPTPSQPVAITLTADQWDTIRAALLMHSMDARQKADGRDYADIIREVYLAINEAFPPGRRC